MENNTSPRRFKHTSEILTLLQILPFPTCFSLVSRFGPGELPALAEILLQAVVSKKSRKRTGQCYYTKEVLRL